MYKYFKRVADVGGGNYICFWKPEEFSDENIAPPATTDYRLTPELSRSRI